MPENPWGPDVAPHPLEEFDAPATAWTDFPWQFPPYYIMPADSGPGPVVVPLRMLMGVGT